MTPAGTIAPGAASPHPGVATPHSGVATPHSGVGHPCPAQPRAITADPPQPSVPHAKERDDATAPGVVIRTDIGGAASAEIDVNHSTPLCRRNVFVGREPEIRALEASMTDALGGRGRVVALVGEPGIGKTRTVEEFLSSPAVAGARVLWGRCPEHDGVPAYWPWVQAIRTYVETTDAEVLRAALGGGATEIAQIVPAVRDRFPELAAATAPVGPEQSRFRFFDGVASFLKRAAERDPLILILDDLHWADDDSMLLLGFVAPEMRRMPRLFGEVARVVDRIPLRGLERAHVQDLVYGACTVRPHDSLVADLHRITEGNPFFLGEVIRMLRTEGRLTSRDLEAGALPLPEEVRQVIRRHVEPLGKEDRRVLAIAAVMGREFELATLQVASDLPADRLLDHLTNACAAGLVEEPAGAVARFRFAHALISETLYGDLTPARRADLHRRIGVALEKLHAGARELPFAELAHHFLHAAPLGDAAIAIDYAVRAGERAVALLGYEEAVRHYERGLEALALQPPDERLRMRLLLALGDARWRAGNNATARESFESAAAIARTLGEREVFARAALGAGRVTAERGALDDRLVQLLEEALRAIPEGDSALRAALTARLAMALYFSRQEARRNTLSEQAVAMARRVGDPAALVAALITRHLMLWGPGDPGERLAITAEARAIADVLPDRQPSFEITRWRILDLEERGEMTAANLELQAYARAAAETRLPTYRWHSTLLRGMRALLAGNFEDAVRLAAEALAWKQDGYVSRAGQSYAIQMFIVHRELGGLEVLEEPFTALAREYATLPVWRCGLALLHFEIGREEAARAGLERLARTGFDDLPRDGNFVPALVLTAELIHLLDDPRHAETLYPLLAPLADRNVTVGPSAGCYGSAARYAGLLAATVGRRADAARHFDDALAMNARVGARTLLAYTQLDYARLLLARRADSDRERAAALLASARTTADELGMPRLRTRLDATPTPAGVADADAAAGRTDGRRAAAVTPPGGGPLVAGLRKNGEYGTVEYGTESFRLKDAKGLAYLATLIRHPGREFHVIDLGGGEASGATPSARDLADSGLGDAGEMLDADARAAYKARLVDLREELEEAREFNDPARAEHAQQEIDVLTQELARAIGIGGRARKAGSVAERARLNVGRAINSVVKKIGAESLGLGQHLAAAVRTGTFCSYTPDPRLPLRWSL